MPPTRATNDVRPQAPPARLEVGPQVAAARQAVLALPTTHLATLVVTGKDRVTWLNGLVTCDLAKRGTGEDDDARYGLIVSRTGRVLADVLVVFEEERLLVVLPTSTVSAVRAHLDHYLVMEDVEVAPGADAFAVWTLHGPGAAGVAATARAAGASGGRSDRTSLGGAVLLAPAERAAAIATVIAGAVRAAGGAMGDDAGWEALRLERAIPRFGSDFDDKAYPQEASLEKVAVSFDKGCYLGQEVVCMLELRGHVKRRLVPLVFEGETPAAGAAVSDAAGTAVGEVTSAAFSPTLGKAVGLAMIKRGAGEAGSTLTVAGADAKVVDRPA